LGIKYLLNAMQSGKAGNLEFFWKQVKQNSPAGIRI